MKFSSLDGLASLKGEYPDPIEENETVGNVSIKEKNDTSLELAKKEEKEIPKLKKGMVIKSIVGDQVIASWPAQKGGFFIRLVPPENVKLGVWAAASNQGYGRGMITFVDRRPVTGEGIEIIEVAEKFAKGKVV